MSSSAYRLTDRVRPDHYDLELRPDLDGGTFAGSVVIRLQVDEPRDRLVLHSLDLDLHDAVVAPDGGDAIEVTDTVVDTGSETVTLVLARTLEAGPATVSLGFGGTFGDQLVGLYRSTFTTTDEEGGETTHTLAVTQFESTHARRAFPCFDEPAMKATFSIAVVADVDHTVVSNGAELDREPLDDGRVRVRFATTMRMSTYLVAVVVGPLEATEPRMVRGRDAEIPLRVVHPPGTAHLCGFALDVAEAALGFFEDYYGIAYPGDKVDLVAVPDFAFGAMENLGCVTFREVLLLVDPDAATQPELQRVADVINHELAHMWFGDLVTMRWWNGIWLNEAFATFMELMASDAFRPEWDVWTTFGLARAAAFDTDTLASTRPIEYEVVTAADSEGMFDILTYEKGASVVRMLEQYLGAEVFRAGIGAYLRRHAYGSTETTDLWDALEEASGEPVRRIMDAWIFTGGHPVVRVEPSAGGLRLTPSRASFGVDADRGEVDGADATWPVPMVLSVVTDADGPRERRVLLEEAVELPTGGEPSSVQANVGGAGFYRVELDGPLRRALLSRGEPSALERFVVVDDTWAGMIAGRVPLGEAVELVAAVAADEPDPSVWRRIAGALRELRRLAGTPSRDRVDGLVTRLTGPALARIESPTGVDAEEDSVRTRAREVRGILVALAGEAGDPQVRDRARGLFEAATTGGGLDPSLRAAVVEVVAAHATPAEHRRLRELWRSAATPQEELRYLNALVDTDDPDLLDESLDLALTEVRTQNAPYLLRRALTHPDLGGRAWDTVAGSWERVVDRFPATSLPRMLEGIRAVTEPELAGRIQEFLADHPVPTGGRQVDQHLERMAVTVVAAARTRAELADEPALLDGAAPGTDG